MRFGGTMSMNRLVTTATIAGLFVLAESVAAQQAVILVRHAEKETDPAKLQGVADRDVPLSDAGKERANHVPL